MPGIFAAGTVEDKHYGKAGIASSSGIKAALDALAFLEGIGLTPYVAKKMEPQFYVARERKTSEIQLITTANEFKKAKTGATAIVIDFFAPYCPSCMHLMPEVEALAAETTGKIRFAKVDVGQTPELAKSLSIMAIPTFIIFKDGKEVARCNHVDSGEILRECLTPWM